MKTRKDGFSILRSVAGVSKLVFLLILLLSFFIASSVLCAEIPWPNTRFSRISQNEDLRELLKDFCASMGIRAVIDQDITGRVNGKFSEYRAGKFFRQIKRGYGLISYFDGRVLFIYPAEKSQSKLIDIKTETVDILVSSLKALDLYDFHCPVKISGKAGLAYVSGPPRYVELVESMAQVLNQKVEAARVSKSIRQEIRVFPLKYAWAADHQFVIQDQKITVPGVATTLYRVLFESEISGGASEGTEMLPNTVEKLKGKGLIATGREDGTGQGNAGPPLNPSGYGSSERKARSAAQSGADSSGGDNFPIQADTRLNAVIVRDFADKMPDYERLIKSLDRPAKLVQIEVSIIELTAGGLAELGVNWRLNAKDHSGKGLFEGGVEAGDDFSPGNAVLGTGSGLNFATTLSLGAGQYLLGQIHALEEDGKGRVFSRPSVLTLDNVQAVIEQTETFYARIAGSYEVDLFNVTAGVTMKVTPHIIEEQDGEHIKLLVDIKDGSVNSDDVVDELPTVPESSIHTQAIIEEGQLLVLGGYIHNQTKKTTSAVPILGSLPLLKWLFSVNTEETKRVERIFLIHPRIIKKSSG